MHSINRCCSATAGIRSCNLETFRHARQPPCVCGHSGYKMLLRLSVLTEKHAIYKKLYPNDTQFKNLIYDYFPLLKPFNTNTLKFSSTFHRQIIFSSPFHMHNTRQRTKFNNNFNTKHLIIQKLKNVFLYVVISIWNSQPNSFKNCTSKFTFKKTY